MATTLEQALSDVELEDGRTYAVRVRGREIEVRVKPSTKSPIAQDRSETESALADLIRTEDGAPGSNRPGSLPLFPPPEVLNQVMIEAPYDLPRLRNGIRCEVRAVAELPRPNNPDIPADEEAV